MRLDNNLDAIKCKLSLKNFSLIERDLVVFRDLKFDTGSDITLLSNRSLGLDCIESVFTNWLQENENVFYIKSGRLNRKSLIGASSKGIDKSSNELHSYCLQLSDFSIITKDGDLSLYSVPIFVTFDKRFKGDLFGRDLLSLLNYSINNDKNILDISLTERYNYDLSNASFCGTPVYFFKKGIYGNGIHRLNENSLVSFNDIEKAFVKLYNEKDRLNR